MFARSLTRITLVSGALAIASCGGDDLPTGSNSGDELATAEVQELMAELFDLLETIDVTIPGLHASNPRLFLSRAGVPIDETFNQTDPCESGGTTTISGSAEGDIDDGTGQGDVTIDADVDFNDCGVDGTQADYTINGDPGIGIRATFEIGANSVTFSLAMSGGVAFTTDDDRAGTCAIDITVNITASETAFNQTASGSACGRSASSLDIELFDDDDF